MKAARTQIYAQALMAAVVVIGLYFMWSFAREVVQAQRLSNQVELERQQNDQLSAENRQLERDKAYVQSDDYVRLRARTDLNLRDPNEVVVYPVLTPTATDGAPAAPGANPAPGAQTAPPAATTAAAPPSDAPLARPWERWLAFFTGPPR